ncbi:soluble NSF attachment family protein [Pandoraea sputorum]|uniref:Uncharacterized protein n=1 Tax=Pandoraea sputorum TaxID=93222 RepID=A0A5E5BHB8_9BURK|nr:hypothetical protein [Pandoraea sputorum]VVE85591.1 hypothetical protein PSP31121_05317 [Pandoraea sputorum]
MSDHFVLSVRGYAVPLVSPKRQDAIKAALRTVDFTRAPSVDAAHRQITHMGALDRLCDRWFHDSHKTEALEVLASLILQRLYDEREQNGAPPPGDRQRAYIKLAQWLSELGKATLLQSDAANLPDNEFTKFLGEADWRSLAGQVRLDGTVKLESAAQRPSYGAAADSFAAAAAVHANAGRWAQAAKERWRAADLYLEAGLNIKAAEAFGQAADDYAKADPSGWQTPSQTVQQACRAAAVAWKFVVRECLSAETREEAYRNAVASYERGGMFASVACTYREIAAGYKDEDEGAAQYELAAANYCLAAAAEERGKDPRAAASDYRKAAGLLRVLYGMHGESRVAVQVGDMYLKAAKAHEAAGQDLRAADAATQAVVYLSVGCQDKAAADAYETAGAADVRAGRLEQGAFSYWQAALIRKEMGLNDSAGEAFTAAGDALLKANMHDRAIEAHQQAEAVYRSADMHAAAEAAGVAAQGVAAERIKYKEAEAARAPAERIRQEEAEAAPVAAPLLDLKGFILQLRPDRATAKQINATLAAHLPALASEHGLDADGRSLRMDEKADFVTGEDFDERLDQRWLLLYRGGNVWDVVTWQAIVDILSRSAPGKEPERLNPFLRRAMQVEDVCQGAKFWEILSKMTVPQKRQEVPSQ